MEKSDYQKRLQLTEEQQAVLKELDEAFAKAEKAGIEIYYDSNDFMFAAANTLEVETIGAKNKSEDPEDSVDVDGLLPWGNIFPNIRVYDSYYERIHAKFKEA